jgi:hypothetical protein
MVRTWARIAHTRSRLANLVTPPLLQPYGITHEPGTGGKLQARLLHDGHQDILVDQLGKGG